MKRSDDQFLSGRFEWFIGVVEDINDPDKINRVRVRCFGYHTTDTNKISIDSLPWATVMMPTTSASYKGTGSNHELMVGSWVVGFFRDGPSAQDPIIMGSIATQTDGVTDIPTETQDNYPNRKVHKTAAGHTIEMDNTEGSEEIKIEHSSGLSHITFNTDGSISVIAPVIYLNGKPN